MSGSGGGESGTAAGAPRGTCEEAEHLDGAGRADGGEVGERGRRAFAHGRAAVLWQMRSS